VGRAYKRRERTVAAHDKPVNPGSAPQRRVMVAKVGSQYWLIHKMGGGTLLDDDAAVQVAVRTGSKLGVFDSLPAAAAALRAWLADE
jgi:hypothetical protein